jgi:hypothetical protein
MILTIFALLISFLRNTKGTSMEYEAKYITEDIKLSVMKTSFQVGHNV